MKTLQELLALSVSIKEADEVGAESPEDANAPGEEVEPRILAKTASVGGITYMAVLNPTTEEVQIVDESHKVYLQVPLITWQQLSRQG